MDECVCNACNAMTMAQDLPWLSQGPGAPAHLSLGRRRQPCRSSVPAWAGVCAYSFKFPRKLPLLWEYAVSLWPPGYSLPCRVLLNVLARRELEVTKFLCTKNVLEEQIIT